MKESSPPDSASPKGLTLFTPDKPPAYRRQRLIFVAILVVVEVCLIWPIYPLASRIEPTILGLPFALVWVIINLLVVFAALIWLFRSESPSTDGR